MVQLLQKRRKETALSGQFFSFPKLADRWEIENTITKGNKGVMKRKISGFFVVWIVDELIIDHPAVWQIQIENFEYERNCISNWRNSKNWKINGFLNVPISILVFKLFHVIQNRSKISKLEKFERFENGFLNISIQNYSALYRSKTYVISNVEKLYFDSHEIGKIERIGEILECSNSNISLQELYFDSHGIGGIPQIRGWLLECSNSKLFRGIQNRSKISNVEKLYFNSHGIGGIGEILEYFNSNISPILEELYFDYHGIEEIRES